MADQADLVEIQATLPRWAYKPIETVMADQADLVEIQATLHQIANYKGA